MKLSGVCHLQLGNACLLVGFCCFCGSAIAEEAPKILPLMSAPPKALRAEKKRLVALPNYDEITATRLQIFLDNNDFGPGKIDGEMGEFFRKALLAYKRAHLMPLYGTVDQWLLDQVPETFTNYMAPFSSSWRNVFIPRRITCAN